MKGFPYNTVALVSDKIITAILVSTAFTLEIPLAPPIFFSRSLGYSQIYEKNFK